MGDIVTYYSELSSKPSARKGPCLQTIRILTTYNMYFTSEAKHCIMKLCDYESDSKAGGCMHKTSQKVIWMHNGKSNNYSSQFKSVIIDRNILKTAAIANDHLKPVLKWFPKPTRKPKEQRDKFLNRIKLQCHFWGSNLWLPNYVYTWQVPGSLTSQGWVEAAICKCNDVIK